MSVGSPQSCVAPTSSNQAFKIALVGGPGAGKTSLLLRFLNPNADDFVAVPTICVDVHVHARPNPTPRLNGDSKSSPPSAAAPPVLIFLECWDISHREIRGPHLGHFLNGINGIILVVDPHQLSSIQALDDWRAVLALHQCDRDIPLVLAVNKRDLSLPTISVSGSMGSMAQLAQASHTTHNPRLLTSELLENYCLAAGIRAWKYTSTKAGAMSARSVRELFDTLTTLMIQCSLERESKQKRLRQLLEAQPAPRASSPQHSTRNLSSSRSFSRNTRSLIQQDLPNIPMCEKPCLYSAPSLAAPSVCLPELRHSDGVLGDGKQSPELNTSGSTGALSRTALKWLRSELKEVHAFVKAEGSAAIDQLSEYSQMQFFPSREDTHRADAINRLKGQVYILIDCPLVCMQ